MLHSVYGEYFRKHEKIEVNFTPGINAIRVQNEGGKSSLIELITYCLFGAKGLKEAIDDVVTYDQPASKLKGRLSFSHAGVKYDLKRSKSGAELTFDGGVVTGQTEVTKYVERLLGTSQDMAARLMLAKQKNLGGALTEGATAAGKMIEDLADLDLIDELIALVTENLPSGRPDAAAALVANLRAQADEAVDDQLDPLEHAAAQAKQYAESTFEAHARLKARLGDLDVEHAHQVHLEQKALTAQVADARACLTRWQEQVDAQLPASVAQSEIDAAYAAVEQEKQYASIAKIHGELVAAAIEPGQWDQPLETLQAEIAATSEKVATAETDLRAHDRAAQAENAALLEESNANRQEQIRLEGQLVKENSCAFCGKDLKDVPEVKLHNDPLYTRLRDLTTAQNQLLFQAAEAKQRQAQQRQTIENALAEQRSYLSDLQAVVKANDRAELLYAKAGEHIKVDRSSVPGAWAWAGPQISDQREDVKGALAQLLADQKRYNDAVAARAAAAERVAHYRHLLDQADTQLATLPVKKAAATLEQADALRPQVAEADRAYQAARALEIKAENELATAKAVRDSKLAAREKARVQLAEALADLAELEANNELVKKLRAARPKITDKLWAAVLAAVSTYCAEMRGEQSVITRQDGKFLINGRPVTGLSGSAEDVLGLSIRYALTKMFLPNVDFLILDEVAAACDDDRETKMLGFLATSGFAQTILVTHSPLADSFADNIITW